ncbi:MAG: flagellar protein FliS [candidate division BRC1 bacterium ADurb.BinA364]|nr:MAG: flagellar protein FliS [candidate division BRC1 bacterium ADurb.BinA364]
MELANALDFTASPQLASRLNALYNFIVDGLVESIRDRDPKRLRACEGLLATLAEAWRHVTRPQPSLPPKIDSNQYSRRTIALSA